MPQRRAEAKQPDASKLDATLARRLTITLLIFALYTIGRFGIDQIRPPGLIPNDYMNFHHAADRLRGGIDVYEPGDQSPYKYSPTFLVAFAATFDQLPHAWAWGFWCALSIFAFAWATRWLWLAGLGRIDGRTLTLLVAAFGVFFWHGYIEHFSYGQGDMFVYAAFIAAVAARRDSVAALIVSALLVTKPQSGILLAYFLVGRRWRMLASTAALTVLLLLAPALGWGWSRQLTMFSRWWFVLSSQSVEFLTGNLNQSVAAVLARLSHRRELVTMLTPMFVAIGGAAACAAALFRPLAAHAPPEKKASAALATLLLYALVCPLSWRWSTFVWLPLGVMLAAHALRQHCSPALAALSLFALVAILLQTFVAHLVGVTEIDELSRLGFYALGNVLLVAAFVALRPDWSGPRTRAAPR